MRLNCCLNILIRREGSDLRSLETSNSSIFFSDPSDLVFNLESSESLMVQHFPNLSSIKPEVSMREVNKAYDSHE